MAKRKKEILHKLFIELVKLQKEIIASNLKLMIILEGKDAAGYALKRQWASAP